MALPELMTEEAWVIETEAAKAMELAETLALDSAIQSESENKKKYKIPDL